MARSPAPDTDVPGRAGHGRLAERGLGGDPDGTGGCHAGLGAGTAEEERWRNDSRWLRLGASVILPRGFTVGGSGELRRTDYEGKWFPFTTTGEPREDRTLSLRASVHNRVFAWKGFSPQLSLVHEVRTTNAQLYDYKRTGGELRFVRLF